LKLKKPILPSATLFDEISSQWSEIADANSTEKQVAFLKNKVAIEGLVLDLSCGNGRHTVALCEGGYNMVGLDISGRLLEIAKKKAADVSVNVSLVRADMRFLPFYSNVFSAVLSLDSSFGYLPSESEDVKSFSEIARTLVADGIFLIDVFNRERMVQRYRRNISFGFLNLFFGLSRRLSGRLAGLYKWREYPSFFLLHKRYVDAKKDTLFDLWVFRDKKTARTSVFHHAVRLYGFSLLRILLRKAGLQVTNVYGNYEAQELSEGSSRLIVIAAKI